MTAVCIRLSLSLCVCFRVIMALNIAGVVAVVVFYLLILVIGVWASKKSKKEEKKCSGPMSEFAMIGDRNINLLVGIFTMTGMTWVSNPTLMRCYQ